MKLDRVVSVATREQMVIREQLDSRAATEETDLEEAQDRQGVQVRSKVMQRPGTFKKRSFSTIINNLF